MHDITRLRQLLTEYDRALADNVERVTEAHRLMQERYLTLRPVYDGAAAGEFKAAWEKTSAAFDAYIDGVPGLHRLLQDRIAALDDVDRSI